MVSSVAELSEAWSAAEPGDVITLAAGTYDVDRNLTTPRDGRDGAPITVRGPESGEALIRFSRSDGGVVEGFKVQHAYWHFEGLVLEGGCADDSRCEHAWHLAGNADHVVIRGCIARNFNAHIKANGQGSSGPSNFPDDVLIEGNEFYSTAVRDTNTPVTPIDVVGGRRWVVRANFIHDHAKGRSDGISYAAFLKGGSADGIIERNLVICELLHSGQTRLGLSFGGGGTGPASVCEGGSCSPEHTGGIMRNNLVVNCPADVGVFVRECDGCLVLHNTLFNTSGIDFIENSTGAARGNLLSGRIRDRLGSSTSSEDNLSMVSLEDFRAWFRDPDAADFRLAGDGASFIDVASSVPEVTDDYCRNPRRDGQHDIGALEYGDATVCDTTMPGWGDSEPGPMPDAGMPMSDAGATSDAGSMADAAAEDAAAGDAAAGAGPMTAEGGCGCRIGNQGRPFLSSGSHSVGLVGLLLALWIRRRRD
jgi:hypothetical protein